VKKLHTAALKLRLMTSAVPTMQLRLRLKLVALLVSHFTQ
jgi:hypothetical protein